MLISRALQMEGGARPKACVTDEQRPLVDYQGFPNLNDTHDVGAWEMVCYELALAAGVDMFQVRLGSFPQGIIPFNKTVCAGSEKYILNIGHDTASIL